MSDMVVRGVPTVSAVVRRAIAGSQGIAVDYNLVLEQNKARVQRDYRGPIECVPDYELRWYVHYDTPYESHHHGLVHLKGPFSAEEDGARIFAHFILEDWDPDTLCWNNKPTDEHGSHPLLGSVSVQEEGTVFSVEVSKAHRHSLLVTPPDYEVVYGFALVIPALDAGGAHIEEFSDVTILEG